MADEYDTIDPGFDCHSPGIRNRVIFFLTLGIACLLSTFTLGFILCNRHLRHRRFIFQFNIILADLVCNVGYILAASIQWHIDTVTFIPVFLAAPLIISVINVLFVAVYQLITIRIDPFGVRNIITATRCVIACIASWIVSGGVLALSNYFDDALNGTVRELVVVIFTLLVFTLTGMCLCLIFSVVAKAPCDNVQLKERKQENKRVLRTFALIYGTSLIAAGMTCALSIKLYVSKTNFVSANSSDPCLVFLVTLVTAFNWIANSVVYLWRLKEFRSIVFSCGGNSRVEAVN